MIITASDLPAILASHAAWLRNEDGGIRADLTGADLSRADLTGANLRGADLTGADLTDADLTDASLRGAILRRCIGNIDRIKSIQVDIWHVTWCDDLLAIGCQQHSITDWAAFSDERIASMDSHALDWWRKWRPILAQMPGLEALKVEDGQ